MIGNRLHYSLEPAGKTLSTSFSVCNPTLQAVQSVVAANPLSHDRWAYMHHLYW
jgi:hypothetical protein